MKKRLRIVGVVLAATGGGFAVVGLFRSYAEVPGPWTSISLLFIVLSLVCLALGISGNRHDT